MQDAAPLVHDRSKIGALCVNKNVSRIWGKEEKPMVSWGYIDDSTKGDSLVLSCAMIESSAGFWLENEWKSVIDVKNTELSKAGRPVISRFHGAACNACKGEFRDWDKDKDQIPFIKSLQAQIQKYRI